MKDIILDEACRSITVRDGDCNVTVPMAQAIIRSLAVNAAKGQHRAQRLFAELLAATKRSRAELHERLLSSAIEYKVAWEREACASRNTRDHGSVSTTAAPGSCYRRHTERVGPVCRSSDQRIEG